MDRVGVEPASATGPYIRNNMGATCGILFRPTLNDGGSEKRYALPTDDSGPDLSPRRPCAPVSLLALFGARLSWDHCAFDRFSLPPPHNLGLRVDGEFGTADRGP